MKLFITLTLQMVMIFVFPDTGRAQTTLVKDINLESPQMGGNILFNVNGTLFFLKFTKNTNTRELWKTDGTTVGTVLVKSLLFTYSNSTYAAINNMLYFAAADSVNTSDQELWKTDGTPEGTVRVKDINPGIDYGSNIDNLTNVNGILFFTALGELWKSDGTEAGTVMVKDIYPAGLSYPIQLTNVNGTLFFMADDGVNGRELWKSDGTAAGTIMVKDINTGSAGSVPFYFSDPFHASLNINGTFFFRATNGINGEELWKSDGTAAGTVMVKDINTGSATSSPTNFVNLNGTLCFLSAVDNSSIWKSDGTEAGTVKLLSGVTEAFQNLTAANGNLFFTKFGAGELWKLNPTTNATTLLMPIKLKDPNYYFSSYHFTPLGANLYFVNYDTSTGQELWKTDGTAGGTTIVKDIYPGVSHGFPSNLVLADNKIYFGAFDGEGENLALWKSDGTTAGTVKIKEDAFNVLNFGSNAQSGPEYLTKVGDIAFFVANSYPTGLELWKSDGTKAGTMIVKKINPNTAGSSPRRLYNANGILYFSANDGVNGEELWKSDGTEAGTVMVKDIYPGTNSGNPYSSSPNFFTYVNGTIFFIATNATNGRELWKTDGTTAGTVLVKDIFPGTNYNNTSIPRNLVNYNGTLYFSANDNVYGRELWKSDGTAAGTVRVTDIYPGQYGGINPSIYSNFTSSASNLIVANNFIYFQGTNSEESGGTGWELWRSDGTAAGTILLKDIRPGTANGVTIGGEIVSSNGTVYFSAVNETYGEELWKTDGTVAGTVLVKDIYTDLWYGSPASGSPHNLTDVNGTLFFEATSSYDPTARGLWKSDGTAANTVKVKDFGNANIDLLSKLGNELYFVAGLDALWKSDGTEIGTTLVKSLKMGLTWEFSIDADNVRRKLLAVNDRLFYYADDNIHGSELWSTYVLACPANLTIESPPAVNGIDYSSSPPAILRQANAATGSIVATNKVTGTANVTYEAKNVTLNAGFKAEAGTVFIAQVGGCN